VQIRVEKILPANLKKEYPKCIGGSRAGPPEDCGGACAFMQLENHYSPWEIQEQLIKVLKNDNAEEKIDLQKLMYWINHNEFDRRSANLQIKELKDAMNNKEVYR
jgi:hypothetical protein